MRRSGYKKQYHHLVYHFSLLGATDVELAKGLDISERTLNYWKSRHPSFLQSIKKGKEDADARVAHSLFHRAIGYEHEDTDIRVIDKEIVTTTIKKYYPPDTTAAIFWLKNRQPDKWRDVKAVEMTSKNVHVFKDELKEKRKLSEDELLREINEALSAN